MGQGRFQVGFLASVMGLAAGCAPQLPGLAPEGAGDEPIIGGSVDTGDPAVALIVFQDPSNGESYVCTGTLISPTAILTAGHCSVKNAECNAPGGPSTCYAAPAAGYVVLGGTYPIDSSWNLKSPTWSASVTGVHPHPGYGSDATGAPFHDLAILNIGPIQVHSGSAPQPLAWLSAVDNSVFATGKTFKAVGYGVTNGQSGAGTGTKRMVTLTIEDHDAATFSYGTSSQNTCSGDSGGPAIQVIAGVPTVIGTTSYGDYNCTQSGVNMRTDYDRAFIAQWAGSSSPGPTPTPTPAPGSCANGSFGAAGLPKSIPDSNAAGVSSTVTVSGSGNVGSLALSLSITHTYTGDLTVTLTAPDGTSYVAWNQAGGSANDIELSGQAIGAFTGHAAAGTWTLRVVDSNAQDVGTLDAWSIALVGDCSGATSGWAASDDPGLPILDDGAACTSVNVTGSGNAAAVKLDLAGTHSYRSVLRATLAHGGVTKEAFPTGTFATGAGSFSQTSRAVAGFTGSATGTWTLCVVDTDAYGDTGSLGTWGVHE